MTADQTTVLVLYSAGLLACGAGIGYCLGWFGGRRKMKADLHALYRERVKPMGVVVRGEIRDRDAIVRSFKGGETFTVGTSRSVSHEATGLNVVRMTLDGEGHVHTGHPLYDQEHER